LCDAGGEASRLQAKIVELTVENNFLEGAFIKAITLSA
jgi:hypothetical protein